MLILIFTDVEVKLSLKSYGRLFKQDAPLARGLTT